jgi:hypothetical protein
VSAVDREGRERGSEGARERESEGARERLSEGAIERGGEEGKRGREGGGIERALGIVVFYAGCYRLERA